MEQTATLSSIETLLKHTITYCNQLSQVLHTWTVLQDCPRPGYFDECLQSIDDTTQTLAQLSAIIEIQRNPASKPLFNKEGLARASLLTKECFTEVSRIELAIRKCASRGVHVEVSDQAHASRGTLTASEFLETKNADPLLKSFDAKEFLELVERMRCVLIETDIERCVTRLRDLTQNIILLSQIAELQRRCVFPAFSQITLFNVFDAKNACSYDGEKPSVEDTVILYARISRAADLVDLAPDEEDESDSSSTYYDTESNSDSDSDSDSERSARSRSTCGSRSRSRSGSSRGTSYPMRPRGRRVSFSLRRGGSVGSDRSFSPRPRSPPRWPTPIQRWSDRSLTPPPRQVPPFTNARTSVAFASPGNENGSPPSYIESRRPFSSGPCTVISMAAPIPPVSPFKPGKSTVSVEVSEQAEQAETVEIVPNVTPKEGQLFKSEPHGMFYKLQFYLRPSSLAAEITSVLAATDSKLSAYLIQTNMLREIPHSAFHTLESTHLRALLFHGSNTSNGWYKTFCKLTNDEHRQLDGVLHQRDANGVLRHREIVVLQVAKQNKANMWLRMLVRRLGNGTRVELPVEVRNNRVILAIMREKISENIPPLPAGTYAYLGAHPPPPPVVPVSQVRVPPLPIIKRPDGPSDLRILPPPPLVPSYPLPPPAGRSVGALQGVLTPEKAREALTTFNEYHLDVLPASQAPGAPQQPPNWQRINITQSTTAGPTDLLKHLNAELINNCTLNPTPPPTPTHTTRTEVFNSHPPITPAQDLHLSRLLAQLQASDRDSNFEWKWVWLGLRFGTGSAQELQEFTGVQNATSIHVIAARTPVAGIDCIALYGEMCKNPFSPRLTHHPPPLRRAPSPVVVVRTPVSPRARPRPRSRTPLREVARRRRRERQEKEWIQSRAEEDLQIRFGDLAPSRKGIADALLKLWCRE
ncbi:hypothetical protein BP5796_02221 [Coleophoma crateriformis]|uniref:Uncharacterized protein n=1 Tax=Coleophoma crateriformis TaxID=565419 RepID=A0A3D8SXM1_9HELO|nr:hypothetical protein BP5796_02221 [Coleophoma crateriformis]